MPNRLIGTNKFILVDEVDGYIHKTHLRFGKSCFYFTNKGKEDVISLRFGKEYFLKKLSEFNPTKRNIYISEDDFEELCLYLADPDAYVKAMDEFFEREQQQETEDKIMDERTSDEDYESQKRDYNPDFDNFNVDDYDSSFYDAE